LNIDALKKLARTTYKSEYYDKTPSGAVETGLLSLGVFFVAGALLAGAAGVGALLLSAAAAPALIAGAVVSAALGIGGIASGVAITTARAEHALNRDLNNGVLIHRFEDEVLASNMLLGPGAAAAFTAAAGDAPVANDNPAIKEAAPKIPSARL
jgi:hypothetical protein